MADSQTMRAIGTDPHYTRILAAESVSAVRAVLQLLVIEGWLTSQRADQLSESLFEPSRAILLKAAWFYYNAGYKKALRDSAVQAPPEPEIPSPLDPHGPVLRPTVSFAAVDPSLHPRKKSTE